MRYYTTTITTTFILSIFFFLGSKVFADDLVIYEPPAFGIFYADSPMDIRYRVRKNGMAALSSTRVSLLNGKTKEFVMDFPNATWTSSYTSENAVHDLWYIPPTFKNGTYTLRVAGNATYPCSVSDNGKAPYNRCQLEIKKDVTFIITMPI